MILNCNLNIRKLSDKWYMFNWSNKNLFVLDEGILIRDCAVQYSNKKLKCLIL